MSQLSLIEAIVDQFNKGTAASNSWAGGLAQVARAFKNTQRPSIEFIRNLMYGRGLFKAITNTVTAMQTFAKTIQVVKGAIGFAMPAFEYLNNTLGITDKLSAVGQAFSGKFNLGGIQAEAANVAQLFDFGEGLLDKAIGNIDDLFHKTGINDVMSALKRLDFGGAIKAIGKGGVLPALLRLAILIFGPIKLGLKLFKALYIMITKTILMVLPYMVYVFGLIIAAMVVVRLLYETAGVIFDVIAGAWEVLWPTISTFFGHVGDFLGVFFGAIGGIFGFIFGNTSLEEMLFGIFDLLPAVLNFVLKGVFALVVGVALTIAAAFVALANTLWNRGVSYLQDNFLKSIGIIALSLAVLIWGGAFYVAGVALLIYFGKWMVNRFTNYFSGGFWNAVSNWWSSAIGSIWEQFKDWWDGLEFLADGGVATGGMAVVGERGPELVNLPRGARVHSNANSRRMVATAQGGTIIHNNITINARDTSDGELRRIAERIGNMVNNKINRTTSSRTMG